MDNMILMPDTTVQNKKKLLNIKFLGISSKLTD